MCSYIRWVHNIPTAGYGTNRCINSLVAGLKAFDLFSKMLNPTFSMDNMHGDTNK